MQVSTVNPYDVPLVDGSRPASFKIMERTHVFDTNLQKELLTEYEQDSKNKSQACGTTKSKIFLLPFDKLDMDNNHSSTNSGYDNHSCFNFPFYHALNQVDSSINLLDEAILTEVVLRPTK